MWLKMNAGAVFAIALFAASFVGAPAAELVDISVAAGEPPLQRATCIPWQLPACYSYAEPSIAVNPVDPRSIAVVVFAAGWGDGVNAPVFKSSDAGTTWRRVDQISRPPGNDVVGPADQKIAFDAAGRLYVAELAIDKGAPDGPQVLNYIYHESGGSDSILQPGVGYGDDQPDIAVDLLANASCQDTIYSAWLDSKHGQSNTAVSSDQGRTVTNAIIGDVDQFENRTTRVAVGVQSRAFIVYKTREGFAGGTKFEYVHYVVKRSDDCGKTWAGIGPRGVSITGRDQAKTYFTESFGNGTKGMVARSRSSDAWIASGPAGELVVAYVNADASGFAQIYVARSTDRGATWASSRVTDGTHNSSYPEVAIASNATIGVLYVDYDDSGADTVFSHKFARLGAQSNAWNTELLQTLRLGDSARLQSDPSACCMNAQAGYLWGDYEGLTASGTTFVGVFGGESIGRAAPQLAPIFFTEQG